MAQIYNPPLPPRPWWRLATRPLGRAVREVATHWPVWYLLLIVQSMQATALAQTGQWPSLLLLAAPLGAVALYYYVRIHDDAGIAAKGGAYLASALGAAGLLSLTFLPGGHVPVSRETLLWQDEVSTALSVPLLALHCYCTQGRTRTVQFFGLALLYGCLLETAGVALAFFQEPGYHVYLPGLPAPVATMLGWSSVFYITVVLVDPLRRWLPAGAGGMLGGALAVTLAALALDLQIDPVATAVQFWIWNPVLRAEPHLAGVPVVNFAAWGGACLAFAAAYFWVEAHAQWRPRRRVAVLAGLLPGCLAAGGLLTLGAMALVAGPASPSVLLLTQAVLRVLQGMPPG